MVDQCLAGINTTLLLKEYVKFLALDAETYKG